MTPPKKLRRQSLLRQTLFTDLLLTAASVVLLAFVLVVVEQNELREEGQRHALGTANSVARESALSLMLGNRQLLEAAGDRAMADSDVRYMVWTTEDGRVAAVSTSPRWREKVPTDSRNHEGIREWQPPGQPGIIEVTTSIRAEARTDLLDGTDTSSSRILGYVRLGISKERYLQIFYAQIRIAIPVALAVLVLGAFFRIAGFRRISKPLENLVRFTRQVESGDHTVRATVFARDEIGQLAAAFNR